MSGKVKEVLVGVIPTPDGKGNVVAHPIMFAGPNPFIPKGIYTETNPPPGWTWPPFLAKAKKHDGHGVFVVYEGAENAAVKKVLTENLAAADKQMAEQEKVRKQMVHGRHPEKPAPELKEAAAGGDK